MIDELTSLRSRIADLTSEREALTKGSDYFTTAEALARIEKFVDHLSSQVAGEAFVGGFATRHHVMPQPIAPDLTDPGLRAFAVGCWINPAAAKAKLREAANVAFRDLPKPIANAASRLAEIKPLLFRLEIEEERLITKAELEGRFIPRREDADPAAVLAAVEGEHE